MKKKWINKSMKFLLALLVSVSSFTTVNAEDGNKEFEEYLDGEFKETMESDYLSLHFTLRDYESYGIKKPELNLGDASLQSYQDAIEENNAILKDLEGFDYNSLSERQKYDYDVLKSYIEKANGLNAYPMLDSLFNPYSGVLDNIITNFEEFVFYKKEDIDDYIELLISIRPFFEECLEVTEAQVKEGIFLTDTLLDETIDFIDGFTSKTTDNAMVVSFNNRIDEFEGLSEAEKTAYKEKNLETIEKHVIPAYRMVADRLETWRGSNKYSGGVANYPNGKEYYAALAKAKSSTDLSVEELIELCEDYIDQIFSVYMELYMYDQNLDRHLSSATTGLETAEDVLSYLQNHLEDYPTGPYVTYKSSYLDPTIANDSIVAYYMQPPIDDIVNNVIKINGDNISDEIELFGTLAHEGFPGHLYQITWYLDQKPHPIRQVTSNIGYTEGWAMYTEFDSYAKSNLDPVVGLAYGAETGLGYVMNAYCDLGVNGLGWTEQELADKLNALGLNGEAAQSLYEFVISRPGMILPYGIGMAFLQKQRAKAYASLEEDFDIVEFNDILLKNGDRPLEIVEKDVDAYIRSKGKDVDTDYGIFVEYEDYMTDQVFGEESSSSPYEGFNWDSYTPGGYTRESKIPYYIFGGILGVVAIIAAVLLAKNAKKGPFDK